MELRSYVVTVIGTDSSAVSREVEELAYDAADALVQVGVRLQNSLRFDGQRMVPAARVVGIRPAGARVDFSEVERT